ncbi:hypothetical protein [Yersinia aleksiciae]|uniref:hypothetical protein n=1 Tax=Yersinia aleksiciae TaxID=263819 RepID=UPI0016439891|nr:hypothetical protein [Yersinia aleksiciae]
MKRLPNATQLEAQQYEEENARRIQEQEQPTALSQGQQLPPPADCNVQYSKK